MSRFNLRNAVIDAIERGSRYYDDEARKALPVALNPGLSYDRSVDFSAMVGVIRQRRIRLEMWNTTAVQDGVGSICDHTPRIIRQFHGYIYGDVITDLHRLRDAIYSNYGLDHDASRQIDRLVKKWEGEEI